MTPIADMIEQMLADNAPMTAILAAVRAMERVTLANVRFAENNVRHNVMQNRARQKKWYNNQKNQKLTKEAQANDGASNLTLPNVRDVSSPCDLSSFLTSSIGRPLTKESKRQVVARARGSRLEAGAILTEPFQQAAVELGADPNEISNAWAEFVDYWIGVPGSRGTKLDWLATWRNRVRDVLKQGKRHGNRTANSRTTGHDAILAAATRAARKLAGDSPVAGRSGETEFSFGDGTEQTNAQSSSGSAEGAGKADDGGKPSAGGVFEGEIIPPDKASAGLSRGWQRY